MSHRYTAEQILSLAPDASSAKAGKQLAVSRKWATLGFNDQAAWGECQGSAKDPYRVEIDLSEPAFRCTCPSRKFPCKHGLGLFLLLDSQRDAFKQKDAPDWVLEWLADRAARAEKRGQRQLIDKDSTPDPAAQAKRAAERSTKVAAGLAEVSLWLEDLVRVGLAAAQTQPYSYWEKMTARMVDAQATGVSRRIRIMSGIPSSGEGWQERLLEQIGKLHLLIKSYKRIDSLPEETQADVRTAIGWTIAQDALQNQPGVHDRWIVLGQRVEQEERLRVQRAWLWGLESRRPALLLHFAPAGTALDTSLISGSAFDGELVFHPGACSLRSLVKTRHSSHEITPSMPGYSTATDAMRSYALALARNPWIESFPIPMQSVVPLQIAKGWCLQDVEGRQLNLARSFAHGWHLLAQSGGRPIDLFGEWDGHKFWPISMWSEGRCISLTQRLDEVPGGAM